MDTLAGSVVATENLESGIAILDNNPAKAEEALSLFAKAAYFGESTALHVARSRAYLLLGDFRSSLTLLRHLGTSDVRRRAAIIAHLDWEGLCLIREKDWEGALDSFTEAIELDPLQSRLYVHRAVVWTSLGAVEKALRDTEAAVETGCRSGDLFVLRSKLFAQIGRQDKADVEMGYAAILTPRHPEVVQFLSAQHSRADGLYQSATLSMLSGDVAAAIATTTKALALAPSHVKSLLLRAAALRATGALDESLADISTAAQADTGDTPAAAAPASVYSSTLAAPVTVGALLARSRAPLPPPAPHNDNPDIAHQRLLTLNAIALRHRVAGRFREAVALFHTILEADPHCVQFLLNRADTLFEAGQLMDAAIDYESVRVMGGDKEAQATTKLSLIHDQYGVAAFNKGRYGDAVEQFTTALSFCTTSADLYVHRCEAYIQLQRLRHAHRDILSALALNPAHPTALRLATQFR